MIFLTWIFSFALGAEVTYSLQCDGNNDLLSFASQPAKSACKHYANKNMSCGDSAVGNSNPNALSLISPLDTFYSSRNSDRYDKNYIKGIVRSALMTGEDPYFMIALAMMEAPPTIDSSNLEYLLFYGIPPLDGIAAVDSLGCSSKQWKGVSIEPKDQSDVDYFNQFSASQLDKKFGMKQIRTFKKGETIQIPQVSSDGKLTGETEDYSAMFDGAVYQDNRRMYMSVIPSKERASILLDGATTASVNKYILAIQKIQNGSSPNYQITTSSGYCEEGCCADLYSQNPLPSEIVDNGSLPLEHPITKDLGNRVGARFLENKFSSASRRDFVKGKSTPSERLAATFQSYNGYGVLGSTEAVSGECIVGVDMKRTPVYGAGLAELMLNAVLANSQVREIVEATQKEVGTTHPIKSYLCRTYGEGKHSIDAEVFANLQERYLRGRPCKSHSYGFSQPQGKKSKRTRSSN